MRQNKNVRMTFRVCCNRFFIGLMSMILLVSCVPMNHGAKVIKGSSLESVDEAELESLMALGFPRSYAEALLPISRLHPNWTFEPLAVPENWEMVLDLEVDEESARNLVPSSSFYVPYRHETNQQVYDTAYYQASRSAVAYFMDPRNFFNEADVFQFYCLSHLEDQSHTREAIVSVLQGTFMENAKVDKTTSYVDAFIQVGEQTGLDAVYLAVKARQEQGLKGSATVKGLVGDRLAEFLQHGEAESDLSKQELLAFNGLYNLYNVGASGNGNFSVLLSAMKRAEKGTPEFEKSWGGSPAWNSVYKSILGGAMTMKSRYVDNDQDTIYLQKFNVSPDSSRRFWGQYMQNVVGALSEGRAVFHAFAAADALDNPCHFRIPVYTDMPQQVCTDPANGTCAYAAVSTTTYRYEVNVNCGNVQQTANDQAARLSLFLQSEGDLVLNGSLLLTGGIRSLEWMIVSRNGELLSGQMWQASDDWSVNDDTVSWKMTVPSDVIADLTDEDTITITVRTEPTNGSGSGHEDALRCRSICLAYVDVTGMAREAQADQ